MAKARNRIGSAPHRAETLWRLTTAKCDQLRDSVRGAQYPFLLSMLWAFVWLVSLYNHELGYTHALISKCEKVIADAEQAKAKSQADLPSTPLHNHRTFLRRGFRGSGHRASEQSSSPSPEYDSQSKATPYRDALQKSSLWRYHDDHHELPDDLYRDIVTSRYKMLVSQQVELWNTSLPGLLARVTVFDMDIIGLLGLTLIFLWFYYATRREYHAIASFVDIEPDVQRNAWLPTLFTLIPKQRYLGPEHYAYAYHAVAHRFLFLFSTPSGPLLLTTIALMTFPAGVAGWNLWTDLRDITAHADLPKQVGVRVAVSGALFAGLCMLTYHVVQNSVRTSVLLNAWWIANSDCWEGDWDESVGDAARAVVIDTLGQHGKYKPDA